MKKLSIGLLLLASCSASEKSAASRELIVCGAAEVFIVEVGRPGKVWSWTAKDRADLPEALRSRFGSTDECKSVDDGRKILITSSGGGVALVERASGTVLFHAHAVNAHSAELLPGNKVVVASSYGTGGNALLLYDLAVSGKPIASDEFHGAHGAVWDPETKVLWALGDSELRAYEVTPAPSLVLTRKFPLPDQGGHDLRPIPRSKDLVVTTNKTVSLFDRETLAFRPHPALADLPGIKGVDVHPGDGRVAYIQAETKYWAERVRLLSPGGELPLPGERIYKARWLIRGF